MQVQSPSLQQHFCEQKCTCHLRRLGGHGAGCSHLDAVPQLGPRRRIIRRLRWYICFCNE